MSRVRASARSGRPVPSAIQSHRSCCYALSSVDNGAYGESRQKSCRLDLPLLQYIYVSSGLENTWLSVDARWLHLLAAVPLTTGNNKRILLYSPCADCARIPAAPERSSSNYYQNILHRRGAPHQECTLPSDETDITTREPTPARGATPGVHAAVGRDRHYHTRTTREPPQQRRGRGLLRQRARSGAHAPTTSFEHPVDERRLLPHSLVVSEGIGPDARGRRTTQYGLIGAPYRDTRSGGAIG